MTNPRVLVVEDEEPLAEILRYNLEAEGFDVDVVARGDEAETRIAEVSPDLVVLDWMLPGTSGLEVCRRLRAHKSTRGIPIIFLTARAEEADRIRGLNTGADDYVVKPFSLPELLARIRGLIRRSNPERLADALEIGGITLDRVAHRVLRNGREVRIGPTEYRLLEVFMERAGRVLSRAQLLDAVWGRDSEVDERTVDVHVGRLRKALIRGRETDPIRTVRSSGYAFDNQPA